MKVIFLTVLLCCVPTLALGEVVRWPIITDLRISSCENYGSGYCNAKVYYESTGTMMVEIQPTTWPENNGVRQISPWGIHCDAGDREANIPFRNCWWLNETDHRPVLTSFCWLENTSSWKLTPDSRCETALHWGYHQGAGPGGECVLFGQPISRTQLRTPMGILNAVDVANSGNAYCKKALPPDVSCEINGPQVINHGVVQAGESSKRDDYWDVDCGGTPKAETIINGDLNRQGVRITASLSVDSPKRLLLRSEVDIGPSAEGGEYSATYVFVVSPY